jgi:hypothetical protein
MTGWNGCVKSEGKSRPNAVTMFMPSTNVIVRRRRASPIEATLLSLHRSEPNERFSLMTDSLFPSTGDSMADAAQKVVQAVGK